MGMEISVTDIATLGSYDGCEVYLPGDSMIEKKHARVIKQAEGFIVENISKSGLVKIDNVELKAGEISSPIAMGSQIWLGNTLVEFK